MGKALLLFCSMKDNKEENKLNAIQRDKRLEARVTQEEYGKVKDLAEQCGMSVSKYTRKCTLGHRPNHHLTEKECEALCSLVDARADILKIRSQVSNMNKDQRALYFGNPRFVEEWMKLTLPIIERWSQIINYIKSPTDL